jgi:hypothetical protein
MNAHGSFYSVSMVNQLKKMRTINNKTDKIKECHMKVILEEKCMGIFTYIVRNSLSRIWLLVNFLGVHHPGPSLFQDC